ncbi:hypothetical protein XA68_11264 [Ophiocordyceps unilateralis]|uniref:Benzoate 4-monooxygenase n=1 Tax=Ophiocordyceps unilateralis TaxID=268505 RepID=A0A2A9PH74_OPHUN|nr:hypothetical protein XA68_11264 [Ophiocordyceps unilateralis]
MAVIEQVLSWWTIPLLLIAWYGHSYFISYRHLRNIPAPFGAQVTNLWLFIVCRLKARSLYVDRAHQRLGKIVRIQPNHISIADESAVAVIYGHGNGFLKSDFYDAFISIRPSVFTTRDRVHHSRKRKLVAHAFATRTVLEFEAYVHRILELFVERMDQLIETSPDRNQAGKPEARVDCFRWLNYLAFDIIGDLTFGAPFGMLQRGADEVETRETPDGPPSYISAVDVLGRRGEVNGVLGCLPWLRSYGRYLPDPFFRRGIDAVNQIAGVAVARVRERLESGPGEKRRDFLARLIEGRDNTGEPLDREEVAAEATAYLVAGSDTTSTTLCAVINSLARHPEILGKLQAELDEAIPEHVAVPRAEDIQDVQYLNWVIDESLRHHTTLGVGLPRLIPSDSPGVTILGRHFRPGTVLSVPAYSLHHDREIWGDDVDEFKPERWESATPRQKKAFIPFSYGPRACVGRNLAEMELRLITATWARRYSFQPMDAEAVLVIKEGFLRKPGRVDVTLSRRR